MRVRDIGQRHRRARGRPAICSTGTVTSHPAVVLPTPPACDTAGAGAALRLRSRNAGSGACSITGGIRPLTPNDDAPPSEGERWLASQYHRRRSSARCEEKPPCMWCQLGEVKMPEVSRSYCRGGAISSQPRQSDRDLMCSQSPTDRTRSVAENLQWSEFRSGHGELPVPWARRDRYQCEATPCAGPLGHHSAAGTALVDRRTAYHGKSTVAVATTSSSRRRTTPRHLAPRTYHRRTHRERSYTAPR